MIAVPPAVLDALAGLYGTSAGQLEHFGGGQKESDGIVYAYPHEAAAQIAVRECRAFLERNPEFERVLLVAFGEETEGALRAAIEACRR